LVTGGMGYIGSHTCVELAKAGYNVVIIDNLSNSSKGVLERINNLSGCSIPFYQSDVRDRDALSQIFTRYSIEGVIHFAGLKAVGESVGQPIEYYSTNVCSSLLLTEVMRDFNCKVFVFSSSATVYGGPHTVPIIENFPLSVTNPYGRSKLIIEDFLRDVFVVECFKRGYEFSRAASLVSRVFKFIFRKAI